jgi:hypothetical protein
MKSDEGGLVRSESCGLAEFFGAGTGAAGRVRRILGGDTLEEQR